MAKKKAKYKTNKRKWKTIKPLTMKQAKKSYKKKGKKMRGY